MVCVSEYGYLAVVKIVVLVKGRDAARLRSKVHIASDGRGICIQAAMMKVSEPMCHDHLVLLGTRKDYFHRCEDPISEGSLGLCSRYPLGV